MAPSCSAAIAFAPSKTTSRHTAPLADAGSQREWCREPSRRAMRPWERSTRTRRAATPFPRYWKRSASSLPEAELQLLERVIAAHELGRIPDAYARAITRLAAAHRLGLVANILSRKGPWLEEFARAGVLHCFATTVFSSDGSSIKPSRKLFDRAVTALAVPRAEVVFVGDSLRCDIGGATAAGLATVWIDRAGHGRQAGDPQPSFVVRDLLELVG